MIVARDAREYAARIESYVGDEIPHLACETVSGARASYAGQEVLLGMPDMIAEVITEMPAVRWVQSTWAGVRPLLEAGRSGYLLTGVKGIFGPLMSEYVIGWMLAHELKLPERIRQQGRRNWHDLSSGTLRGKMAGIMGTGSIGAHIAGMLGHFDVRTRGYSRKGAPVDGFTEVFPRENLFPFLDGLDYLIAVLPETRGTDRLLDAGALAALPCHAVLINVGRSNLVDHEALLDALRNRRLGAAVLDVFEQEPLPPESPLWDAPGLHITAHVAAHSHPADITPIFTGNYERWVNGQPLEFVVDFERGY